MRQKNLWCCSRWRTRALALITSFMLLGCGTSLDQARGLADHRDRSAVAEIRLAVQAIAEDIESSNIKGLQQAHLDSSRFSKFGPREFERQDVDSTNRSEAAFFSSISDAVYEVHDLKIDVFGDVGIATYYPEISFTRGGERISVTGRQTLVFLHTGDGWKIVHEHGTVRR